MRRRWLVLAFLAGGAIAPHLVGGQSTLSGPDLGQTLRGGFVIFLRHGAAETGHRPTAVAELPAPGCHGVDRPLTERGLADVRAIGEAFRRLGLPVGKVLTSPACRAIETAWYAVGRVDGLEPDLLKPRSGEVTQALLAAAPVPGTNTLIVGHLSNAMAASELSPQEGEALIFAAGPGGRARLVARVPVDGWSALAPVSR
jgi:phosphohistidine phosphatase SixA